jgi:hypothetical protein
MFQQRGGSGFLGSALTTAAGVAGGMVAGQALMGLFSPHHDSFGGGFGGGGFAGGQGGPWGGAPGGVVDTGSWGGGAARAGNQDYVDNGGWDQPAAPSDSSWSDGGGWGGGDSGGGGSDDTF